MIDRIRLSGFADEIDADFEKSLCVIRELKLNYIEIRNVEGRGIDTYSLDEVKKIKCKLDECGISVSAIASPIGKVDITDEFQPHFEKFCYLVKIAKILKTKYIRIFSFYIPNDENPEKYRDKVFARLQKLIEYAKANDIVLLHENEKGIYGDTISRCKDLFDSLYCKNFKGVFDFANFIQCKQDTLEAYETLKQYIAYIHVKDAVLENGEVVTAGNGDGHISQILACLIKEGYNGFLSLEPHLIDFEGFSNLEKSTSKKTSNNDGKQAFSLALQAMLNILAMLEQNITTRK